MDSKVDRISRCPAHSPAIRKNLFSAQGRMQGQGMTDGASFPVGRDNDDPSKRLQAISQGLQASGMNPVIIRQ